MSGMAPRVRPSAFWLLAWFAAFGVVGAAVSRQLVDEHGLERVLFWVLAWGTVGLAVGLAVRYSRRS